MYNRCNSGSKMPFRDTASALRQTRDMGILQMLKHCKYREGTSNMENITKAQLILVGGRAAVPNILTVIHQKPQVVIAVCSKESQPDFPKLKEAINKILPDCIVEETTNSVD